MKRDMDLIRELLIKLEDMPMEAGSVYQIDWQDEFFEVLDYDRNTSVKHFKLLLDAGFISGPASQGMTAFIVTGLSWNGHEFIDSIRNPEVWSRTKAGMKTVGDFSLDLVIQLAKAEGKRLITGNCSPTPSGKNLLSISGLDCCRWRRILNRSQNGMTARCNRA